jgi:hypothetical protein
MEIEMGLLNSRSLAKTLDAVGGAHFLGVTIPNPEARRVAAWLVGRQGLQGSYAGMFAPTTKDFTEGISLFTGERITSRAATGHILGEEACRALLLLGVDRRDARDSLDRATVSMDARLRESEAGRRRPGFF